MTLDSTRQTETGVAKKFMRRSRLFVDVETFITFSPGSSLLDCRDK